MGQPFVRWSAELSVGIEEIDAQHKVLVGLLNELHDAIHSRHGSSVVYDILRRLDEYTRVHFAVEESLMRILEYPGYEAHKAQHDQLIDEMKELRAKVEGGRATVSFELLHFLLRWLTEHIQKEDRRYSEHFLRSRVQAEATPEKRPWFTGIWDSLHR